MVRAIDLEQIVLGQIKKIVSNEQIIDDIVNEINSNNNIDTEIIQKQYLEVERQIKKLEDRLVTIKKDFIAEKLKIEEYRDFKGDIEHSLADLFSKKEYMELELAKAFNTTLDAKEVRLVLENFDELMTNAEIQLKKQLLDSLIERINLNPDRTLKSIEFKFEVPNQHVAEVQEKNVILTYGTVLRN